MKYVLESYTNVTPLTEVRNRYRIFEIGLPFSNVEELVICLLALLQSVGLHLNCFVFMLCYEFRLNTSVTCGISTTLIRGLVKLLPHWTPLPLSTLPLESPWNILYLTFMYITIIPEWDMSFADMHVLTQSITYSWIPKLNISYLTVRSKQLQTAWIRNRGANGRKCKYYVPLCCDPYYETAITL